MQKFKAYLKETPQEFPARKEALVKTEKSFAETTLPLPPIVEQNWSEIVPFGDTASMPEFPLSIFTSWLRAFAEGEAEATQTPSDVVGLLLLTVLGIALAKKFEIEIRQGWKEPLNLWTVSAMPSGSRKSPVFRDVTNPVLVWEREERERLLPEAKRIENEKKIMDGRIQQLQQEAVKGKSIIDTELATQEATELLIKFERIDTVVLTKLLLDDSTPEATARVMYEQKGRIGVMSAEGGIFDILNGRYQKGVPNLDVFLKGHAGDFLRVDRVNRESIFIDSPALSLGLSIQPNVLEGLADKQGLRGRGLLARFLFALPLSNVGYRNLQAKAVPERVNYAYSAGIYKLLEIPLPKDPAILKLSTEAEMLFRELESWIEPKLQPFAELEPIADWTSKLAGATARIIALVHVADNFPNWDVPIGLETAEKAVRLAKGYLVPHAKAAFYLMGADEQAEKTKRILRWIVQKGVAEFSKRQVHYDLQGTFKRADELDIPLRILVERNYIREREIPQEEGKAGRKPSPNFEVNPSLMQLTKLTKSEDTSSSINSVNSVMTNSSPEVPDWVMRGTI